MSWKPEFFVDGKWCDNALRFATEQEAKDNAYALFLRWTVPADYRAVESEDPVNYTYHDGRLEAAPSPVDSTLAMVDETLVDSPSGN